jgi:uroporphyrinogen III methyltransferase/synthase
VLELPTIRIAPPESYAQLDAALQQPDTYDWLVFTSVNGVDAFIARLRVLRLDLRSWHRARIAAIGAQTAAAVARYALPVEILPDDFRAEGLRDALAAAGVAGQRILLPRAAGARPLLPQALTELGARVDEAIAYRSVAAGPLSETARQQLVAGEVDLLTFTSSSTVDNFVALAGDALSNLLPRVEVACIGPITAATAAAHGMRVVVLPRQYTIAALIEAIVNHYAATSGG